MKKVIILVRHAKSSWANTDQPDFERPLNERGINDAPIMGTRIKNAGFQPDIIVASAAKRTRQTALALAKAFSLDKKNVSFKEELYHCGPEEFQHCIKQLKDDWDCVTMVAHNPGITEFANQLSKQFRIDNMPTCAVVVAELGAESWKNFTTYDNRVIFFDYPKSKR